MAARGRVIILEIGKSAHVAAEIAETANENIMLYEHGTTFGHNALVSDN